ncbi:hypothetical protein C4J81_15400 [Deltaproteobacteria bacterium Smac51]|nr:hypothetical protein C4J81_10135 [Deltaproteobacteria bacterium Smac51]UQZ90516.1 hypothetical protein C4J81_15400 [Deltaproteobacteria bacterium Smac51]
MKSHDFYIAINSQGDTAPEWVHLIPAGTFSGRDGRGPWTLVNAAAFIKATADYQAGADIIIDYDHQSEFTAQNGQPALAAAWIKELEERPDGIWGRVEWTAKAARMVVAKEYRYMSPVFIYDAKGELTRLDSAALTGKPNLELKSLNKQGAGMDGFLMELAALLGLPDTTTQEEIYEAIRKLKESGESANSEDDEKGANSDGAETPPENLEEAEAILMNAVSDLVNAAEDEAAEPAATNKAANAQMIELGKMVGRLERRLSGMEADKAVNAAVNAGRISPGMREWAKTYAATDPRGFADYVKSAPRIVTPGQSAMNAATRGGGLTSEEKAVCRQLGMSEADFLKSKKGGV